MKNKYYKGMFNDANPTHFQLAKQLRRHSTEAEMKLWNVLSNKGFQDLKFRRQHPFGNFILDFYCHSIKLGIELDGEIHSSETQMEKDKER